jgi:membrane protein implicated in regulation of membrane protease activity
MSVGLVYVGLLIVGVVYAVIAGALGWLADIGGGDAHVDLSGHLDMGHIHPVSGTTIATFITGFGAGGTIAHYVLHWAPLGSAGIAAVSGLLLAGAAYLVLDLIFSQTQAGSEFSAEELSGREAEVITPVPPQGMGEVAFTVRGQREQAAARSAGGVALPRGATVIIEKVVGSTLTVRSKK